MATRQIRYFDSTNKEGSENILKFGDDHAMNGTHPHGSSTGIEIAILNLKSNAKATERQQLRRIPTNVYVTTGQREIARSIDGWVLWKHHDISSQQLYGQVSYIIPRQTRLEKYTGPHKNKMISRTLHHQRQTRISKARHTRQRRPEEKKTQQLN